MGCGHVPDHDPNALPLGNHSRDRIYRGDRLLIPDPTSRRINYFFFHYNDWYRC
jgi:hypothetical protein